jgi:hypothetical protein
MFSLAPRDFSKFNFRIPVKSAAMIVPPRKRAAKNNAVFRIHLPPFARLTFGSDRIAEEVRPMIQLVKD